MRLYKLTLSLVVVLSIFSVGCSSLLRVEYDLACRLQNRGRIQAATRLYRSVLKRIPEMDNHWRSETSYRLGQCLWESGETADALAEFQSAVDAESSNILARLRLGTILLAGGAPERASEQAVAVLRGSYANTDALALLGAASSEAGQDVFAEAAFRQVLEREPGRVNIAIALADLLNRRDRPDDAREVLRNAAANSGSASPLMALGRLEEQEGNSSAAEQAYRQAAVREDTPDVNLRLAQFLERSSQVDEAQQVLERVDRMRPQLPTALPDFELLAGHELAASTKYMDAMRSRAVRGSQDGSPPQLANRSALAARVIEADLQLAQNQNEPARATALARFHLEQYRTELDSGTIAILQAELALAERDVTTAQLQASTAVQLAPKSAVAHYVLGLAKYLAGQRSQARDAWLDAIQQDDDFAPARLALGRGALRSGDASGAEQYVLPVVRSEPANIHALCLYARALLGEGRTGAAAVIANRALSVNEGSAEARVILGEIASGRKQNAEALVQFERALLLDSESHEAIDGLVRVYRKGVITRPMLRRIEAVAAAAPKSAVLMELAGRLYAEHGWYTDAERCLQQASAMNPRRTTAISELARVLAREGKSDAAIEWAKKAGGNLSALATGFRAEQRNDTATAIAQYEAAVREGERTGAAANNLAWLYAQQGRNLDRALALAERARSLAPQEAAVLDTVGVVHLQRREYSQAIDALRGAASLAASQKSRRDMQTAADIRRHLSEAYMRAGLPTEAAAVLNTGAP